MTYMMGYRGDYMGGYRGDPGLFGTIFGGIKRIAGGLIRRTPIGTAVGIGIDVLRKRKRAPEQVLPYMPQMPSMPRGRPGRLPGPPSRDEVFEGQRRKYRRMNVANPKALRRAIRRQAGFVKLARKALRGTGYSIVSRGSGSRRPARVSIRESGPGSVVVR